MVLSQLQGSFAVKEATLAPYRTAAERLINSFKKIVMEHIPGVTNRYADALATLGSKLSFVQEQPNITVIKKGMPIIKAMFQGELLEEKDDWRKPVKEKLGEGSNIKDLKGYAIILGSTLYRKGFNGATKMLGRIRGTSSHAGNTRWRVWRAQGNKEASPAATKFWVLLAYHEERCT
ncbi:hypothetical protein L3X38_017147 [Prunus dulcis]|uniref:RNase H type-1 domain-containing protein n=1 Tax=Prunus dulcis TaxID=3755 RepID=A0AAD4W959_PRUDU|nr:hypothetical protein L3X38_017147 [Prunus dulcis]